MRHTGPGCVVDNPRPLVLAGAVVTSWKFLANYDTDGDAPKPEHTAWLRDNVLGATSPPWVFLRGWASRLGSVQHNARLSQRRVLNVEAFLADSGFPRPKITRADYVGSLWSGDGPADNWRHRCVEVIVSERQIRPVPPPRFIEIPPVDLAGRLSRHFRIRVLAELSVGAAFATAGMLLEIWDTTYCRACRYVYAGGGGGLAIPGPAQLDRVQQVVQGLNLGDAMGGGAGDWSYFHTRHHVDVDAFASPADFGQLQLGGRGRLPGQTPGVADRLLQSSTLHFFAPDPDTPSGLEEISVELAMPPGVINDPTPNLLSTRGSLHLVGSPYPMRGERQPGTGRTVPSRGAHAATIPR